MAKTITIMIKCFIFVVNIDLMGVIFSLPLLGEELVMMRGKWISEISTEII